MLLNHSPDKENRSPEGRRKDKPTKEIRTPQELLQVLALHAIPIAPQLASLILHTHPHNEKEIRLFSGQGQPQELHELRVKVADYEFELKKMGEDFAEFQLLAKMERDKHVRRLREELEFERNRNIEDNSKWEKKFAERLEQHERDCKAYQAKIEEEALKSIADSNAKLQARHDEATHKLNSAHQSAVKALQKAIEELKLDFEQRMRAEREGHQRQLVSQRKTHETVLKEKEQVLESKIVAVESEKKAEMRVVEETRKESSKVQEKYLYQIGTIEREKRKLEEKADEHEMKAKVLAKRLDDRTKELEQLRQTHAEETRKAERDLANALNSARAELSHQKAQFLREEYARTEQLQLKVRKLNDEKQQMQSAYEGLLRTLETRFQRRESKREDIEALREYEEQLVHKQRENSQIYHQLRLVQMEKDNNDKIYTRIFTSAKKDKKSSQKDHNDIHALFKQSNTTDFRHLLKMAHK